MAVLFMQTHLMIHGNGETICFLLQAKQAISANETHILYYFRKEGVRVKKDGQNLTVHCFFTEEGEDPRELIVRSLRAFIERNLRNYAVF